jgi:hypothetical protein
MPTRHVCFNFFFGMFAEIRQNIAWSLSPRRRKQVRMELEQISQTMTMMGQQPACVSSRDARTTAVLWLLTG